MATTMVAPSTTAKSPPVVPSSLQASEALETLIALRNHIFRNNPDPAFIDSYMSKSARGYHAERALLTELKASEKRLSGNVLDVLGIKISDDKDVYAVAMVLGGQSKPSVEDARDSKPTAVAATKAGPFGFLISAVKVKDRWQLVNIDPVTLNPSIVAELEARGISR